jgi:hypothetical protein
MEATGPSETSVDFQRIPRRYIPRDRTSLRIVRRNICQQWTGKDVEGRGSGLIWDTVRAFIWRDWEKQKNLSQDNYCTGRDTGVPLYEHKHYQLSQLAR